MKNIIVIGGGLMGSAVAWKLSDYGEDVLLIEKQDAKFNQGSSFGQARISRSLGSKKDIFSFVHNRTVREIKKLLNFLNGLDASKPHRMNQIYSTTPVNYIYNKNQAEEIDSLLFKKQKDKYKIASDDDAFRKFGVTLPDSQVLIREYKKYSGSLNPERLIKKLRKGIVKKNNKIWFNQQVTKLKKKDGYYEVKILNTKTGKTKILQSKKVIVAAGAYSVPILKQMAPYLKKLIIPKRVLLSFFTINKERYNRLSKRDKKAIRNAHPVFDQNKEMYFSMIEKLKNDGREIFKVGGHALLNNIPDLNQVWKEQPRKKEIKWARKKFKRYFEMLEIYLKKNEINYEGGYNCVYSVSKTKIPFVTNIISKEGIVDPNLILIGGMSGIGAKGCLGYGVIAADLLLGTGESTSIYKKAVRELGNPLVRLRVKKQKRHRKKLWLD